MANDLRADLRGDAQGRTGRVLRAAALRSGGASYNKIAGLLGYATPTAAKRAALAGDRLLKSPPCGVCGRPPTLTSNTKKYCDEKCKQLAYDLLHEVAPISQKRCRVCRVTSDVAHFSKKRRSFDGYMDVCKSCAALTKKQDYEENKEQYAAKSRRYRSENADQIRASKKEYYEANKDAILERTRISRPVRLYGVDPSVYEEMFSSQLGKCGICKQSWTDPSKRMPIDHDHGTNVVRGLLCDSCNMALGHIRDSVETLRRLVGYLETKGAVR